MAKVSLNEHFTFKKLLKISLGPILMMVFLSIYSVVDGIFVSNFCPAEAFAGLNLIFPVVFIVGGIGMMFGTGGAALIGKFLGENKKAEANVVFTNTVISCLILGTICSTLGGIFLEPIAHLLAATNKENSELVIKYAVEYGRVLMFAQPIFMLQSMFQTLLMTNEKPMKSFIFTLIAGITNMVLDACLVPFIGIIGAAIASIVGMFIGGVGSLIYFCLSKDNLFNFVKCKVELGYIFKVITNGSSEFISNASGSIIAIIFNLQLLKYFGNVGVSSYGVIQYVAFIFIAVFIGYSTGIEPAISYHYGAENKNELKNILIKSIIIISIISILMVITGIVLAKPFAILFAAGDQKMIEITVLAMIIYSISFAFSGLCILFSCYFTALNNGIVSAIISMSRCLLFQAGLVFIIPLLFGEYGIFWSVPISELLALVLASFFILIKRKKYGY